MLTRISPTCTIATIITEFSRGGRGTVLWTGMNARLHILPIALVLAVAASACGSGDDRSADGPARVTPDSAATSAPAPASEPAGARPVESEAATNPSPDETPEPPLAPAPIETLPDYVAPVLPAVDLTPVSTPEPQPTMVQFGSDPATQLVSNAPGCASQCISAATLTVAPFGGTADLAVTTNVRARLAIWISPSAIAWNNGVPSFAADAEYTKGKPVLSTEWRHTVTGLRGGVTYHAILRAKDAAGRNAYLTATFTTPTATGPSDLAVGGGCWTQCITSGTVAAGPRYPTASLQVATSVDATLRVWVSTSTPGTIAGNPVLPDEAEINVGGGARRNWSIDVPVAAGSTTHHVVVAATDADGHTSFRTGSFVSGEEPPTRVVITIEKVWIGQDGDPMDVDKGDFTMIYGLIDESNLDAARLTFVERKLSAGDELVPSGAIAWVADVFPGGTLPGFGMSIWEKDPEAIACTNFPGFVFEPFYDDQCNLRANVAYRNLVTLADTNEWLRCSSYGFMGEKEDAACVMVHSASANEQYATFGILVSVQVL